MLRLHFLRHAESEFNVDPESTTFDCALTHAGEQQAASLPAAHYSLVLMSPLKRARETLRLATTISYDELIIIESVREQKIDLCDFMAGEDSNQLESDEDLMTRADTFLTHIVNTYSNSHHTDILVVSHCEFIHACTAESPHNTQYVTLELRRRNNNTSSTISSSSAYSIVPTNMSTNASTSCIAATLYDDVLHLILSYHSFIIHFVSAARTCKRWYASASSMRVRPNENAACRDFVSHNAEQLLNLVRSPLRYYITDLSCTLTQKKDDVIHFLPINLAQAMPHLRELTVTIHLDATYSHKFKESKQVEATTSSLALLPLSLTKLYVYIVSPKSFENVDDPYAHDEEGDGNEEDGEVIQDEKTVVPDEALQIRSIMQSFARSSPLIHYLSCAFISEGWKNHYLPPEALEPFQSHPSLTSLGVVKPSQRCHDLICRMKQLKRIEGVKLGDSDCPRASKNPLVRPVPQLEYYYILLLNEEKCAYFSRMISLTWLHLDDCQIDPGELLCHLPLLKKFDYETCMGGYDIVPQTLVNAIVNFAPQVEDLFLRHEELAPDDMSRLVSGMPRLRVLHLCSIPIGTLDFLKNLASPVLFSYLSLSNVEVDSQTVLDNVPTMLPHLLKFKCLGVTLANESNPDADMDWMKTRSASGRPMVLVK